jgi:hypothetical protein
MNFYKASTPQNAEADWRQLKVEDDKECEFYGALP